MRDWRNWLLPILTFLTAACLTALPPRLSDWGDRELAGSVHAEALREDNNFPLRPPALERRLELAAAMELQDSGGLMDARREFTAQESGEMAKEVRGELAALAELGILPRETAETAEFTFTDVYLRDPVDLASARFVRSVSRQGPMTLLLDGETGRVLRLRIHEWRCPLDPAEAGESFLGRLGLEGELVSGSGGFALFHVPNSGVRYDVLQYRTWMEIRLGLKGAAEEETDKTVSQTAQSPKAAVSQYDA